MKAQRRLAVYCISSFFFLYTSSVLAAPALQCTNPRKDTQYRCNLNMDVTRIERIAELTDELLIFGTNDTPVLKLVSHNGRGKTVLDTCQRLAERIQANANKGWYLKAWVYFKDIPANEILDQAQKNKTVLAIYDSNALSTHPSFVGCAISGINN